MRNYSFFVILMCVASGAYGQDWTLKRKVMESKTRGTAFHSMQALTHKTTRSAGSDGIYQVLEVQKDDLKQVLKDKPGGLIFTVPINANESQSFELVRSDLGDVRFTQNGDQSVTGVDIPVCYRGTAVGKNERNNAMLTISSGYFSFLATYPDRTINITTFDEGTHNELRLYDSRSFHFDNSVPTCGTEKTPTPEAFKAMITARTDNLVEASQDRCVYVFVECFDSLYFNFNKDYQQTINYVYALFNNIATGFLNEQVNIKIVTINVWTSADPYSGVSRNAALADLAARYQDNFWGNICVGLDFGIARRSGVAGAIGRAKNLAPNPTVCTAYTVNAHPFCYNDLNYDQNLQNFPTGANVTQGQVYLVTHEIGHLLGSAHTHWCGWLIGTNPNTFGALDNCAAVEGTCTPGATPPAMGGTIMSYCGTAGNPGINFNNGFGTLPGSAIRTFVDNQPNCIVNCPTCPSNTTIGALGAGTFTYEVSNTITANGATNASTLASLDAGVRVVLSPGFRAVNGTRMRIYINGCGGSR